MATFNYDLGKRSLRMEKKVPSYLLTSLSKELGKKESGSWVSIQYTQENMWKNKINIFEIIA